MSYSEWNEYKFEELTINYNTKRIPLSSKKRLEKQGEFNYYGAQGIIDSIDEYIFEGELFHSSSQMCGAIGESIRINGSTAARGTSLRLCL